MGAELVEVNVSVSDGLSGVGVSSMVGVQVGVVVIVAEGIGLSVEEGGRLGFSRQPIRKNPKTSRKSKDLFAEICIKLYPRV